jgi:hypothetical protein
LQHEAALRLFAGDLIEDEEILASLDKLREDLAHMSAVIATNIARAPSLPHRARYALLLQDLGSRLLQAHADWLDAVERELRGDHDDPSPETQQLLDRAGGKPLHLSGSSGERPDAGDVASDD